MQRCSGGLGKRLMLLCAHEVALVRIGSHRRRGGQGSDRLGRVQVCAALADKHQKSTSMSAAAPRGGGPGKHAYGWHR